MFVQRLHQEAVALNALI